MSRETEIIGDEATTGGMILEPTTKEYHGTYNGIRYLRYRGRFVNNADVPDEKGFDVPYEIVTPDPDEPILRKRNPCVFFEIPHYDAGLVAREDVLKLLPGITHASVGFSLYGNRSLDSSKVRGEKMPPLAPSSISWEAFGYWEAFTDRDILVDFALALRNEPLGLDFDYVYGYGSSDSADTLSQILPEQREPKPPMPVEPPPLFDLSFLVIGPCRLTKDQRDRIPGKVMVLNAEWDFSWIDGDPADSDLFRWYDAGGCPHIPLVPDTTPLTWYYYLRALIVAGHEWVMKETPPPPSQHFKLKPSIGTFGDPIARDAMGNALGGIRHPALETGEARFIARGEGGFYGSYDTMKSIGDEDFYQSWDEYERDFVAAREELNTMGFLLDGDLKWFVLRRGKTFTEAYDAIDWSAEKLSAEAAKVWPSSADSSKRLVAREADPAPGKGAKGRGRSTRPVVPGPGLVPPQGAEPGAHSTLG